MTCQHLQIQTWLFEDGQPAGLWSCVECRSKFVPLTEVIDAVKAEREAQADLKEARHANEKHIARIVSLQDEIRNLTGEER